MGVASRANVGVTIFMVGVLLLFAALASEPALAQADRQDMVSGDQSNGQDNVCPGAEEVASIGPESVSQQETFAITGDSFRVNYDVTIDNDSDFVDISVLDEDGLFVDSESIDGTDTGQFVVLEGSGDFEVEVEVDGDDVQYTATVEDCTGTDGSNGGNNNGGGDGDDNNDGVIDDTVPDKDLPDTGGLPLIVAGVIFLLSAFGILAAWRPGAR